MHCEVLIIEGGDIMGSSRRSEKKRKKQQDSTAASSPSESQPNGGGGGARGKPVSRGKETWLLTTKEERARRSSKAPRCCIGVGRSASICPDEAVAPTYDVDICFEDPSGGSDAASPERTGTSSSTCRTTAGSSSSSNCSSSEALMITPTEKGGRKSGSSSSNPSSTTTTAGSSSSTTSSSSKGGVGSKSSSTSKSVGWGKAWGKGSNNRTVGSGRSSNSKNSSCNSSSGGNGSFAAQLREHGLQLQHIIPDGNCLFRAFAEQHCGHQEQHLRYRAAAIAYMKAHADDFAAFLSEEEGDSFESYLKRMQRPGSWGGQMELQALSQAFKVNLLIHVCSNSSGSFTTSYSSTSTTHHTRSGGSTRRKSSSGRRRRKNSRSRSCERSTSQSADVDVRYKNANTQQRGNRRGAKHGSGTSSAATAAAHLSQQQWLQRERQRRAHAAANKQSLYIRLHADAQSSSSSSPDTRKKKQDEEGVVERGEDEGNMHCKREDQEGNNKYTNCGLSVAAEAIDGTITATDKESCGSSNSNSSSSSRGGGVATQQLWGSRNSSCSNGEEETTTAAATTEEEERENSNGSNIDAPGAVVTGTGGNAAAAIEEEEEETVAGADTTAAALAETALATAAAEAAAAGGGGGKNKCQGWKIWRMQNFSDFHPCLQLAYHADQEHYSSVRLLRSVEPSSRESRKVKTHSSSSSSSSLPRLSAAPARAAPATAGADEKTTVVGTAEAEAKAGIDGETTAKREVPWLDGKMDAAGISVPDVDIKDSTEKEQRHAAVLTTMQANIEKALSAGGETHDGDGVCKVANEEERTKTAALSTSDTQGETLTTAENVLEKRSDGGGAATTTANASAVDHKTSPLVMTTTTTAKRREKCRGDALEVPLQRVASMRSPGEEQSLCGSRLSGSRCSCCCAFHTTSAAAGLISNAARTPHVFVSLHVKLQRADGQTTRRSRDGGREHRSLRSDSCMGHRGSDTSNSSSTRSNSSSTRSNSSEETRQPAGVEETVGVWGGEQEQRLLSLEEDEQVCVGASQDDVLERPSWSSSGSSDSKTTSSTNAAGSRRKPNRGRDLSDSSTLRNSWGSRSSSTQPTSRLTSIGSSTNSITDVDSSRSASGRGSGTEDMRTGSQEESTRTMAARRSGCRGYRGHVSFHINARNRCRSRCMCRRGTLYWCNYSDNVFLPLENASSSCTAIAGCHHAKPTETGHVAACGGELQQASRAWSICSQVLHLPAASVAAEKQLLLQRQQQDESLFSQKLLPLVSDGHNTSCKVTAQRTDVRQTPSRGGRGKGSSHCPNDLLAANDVLGPVRGEAAETRGSEGCDAANDSAVSGPAAAAVAARNVAVAAVGSRADAAPDSCTSQDKRHVTPITPLSQMLGAAGILLQRRCRCSRRTLAEKAAELSTVCAAKTALKQQEGAAHSRAEPDAAAAGDSKKEHDASAQTKGISSTEATPPEHDDGIGAVTVAAANDEMGVMTTEREKKEAEAAPAVATPGCPQRTNISGQYFFVVTQQTHIVLPGCCLYVVDGLKGSRRLDGMMKQLLTGAVTGRFGGATDPSANDYRGSGRKIALQMKTQGEEKEKEEEKRGERVVADIEESSDGQEVLVSCPGEERSGTHAGGETALAGEATLAGSKRCTKGPQEPREMTCIDPLLCRVELHYVDGCCRQKQIISSIHSSFSRGRNRCRSSSLSGGSCSTRSGYYNNTSIDKGTSESRRRCRRSRSLPSPHVRLVVALHGEMCCNIRISSGETILRGGGQKKRAHAAAAGGEAEGGGSPPTTDERASGGEPHRSEAAKRRENGSAAAKATEGCNHQQIAEEKTQSMFVTAPPRSSVGKLSVVAPAFGVSPTVSKRIAAEAGVGGMAMKAEERAGAAAAAAEPHAATTSAFTADLDATAGGTVKEAAKHTATTAPDDHKEKAREENGIGVETSRKSKGDEKGREGRVRGGPGCTSSSSSSYSNGVGDSNSHSKTESSASNSRSSKKKEAKKQKLLFKAMKQQIRQAHKNERRALLMQHSSGGAALGKTHASSANAGAAGSSVNNGDADSSSGAASADLNETMAALRHRFVTV